MCYHRFAVVAACLFLASSSLASASLVSDFDDGTVQGWQNLDPNGFIVDNPGVGGNPGGFLRFTDIFSGSVDPSVVRAPAVFSGDFSGFSSIEFDAYLVAGNVQANAVRIESTDGTIWVYRPDIVAFNTWVHHSAPINDGTGWYLSTLTAGNTPFADVKTTVKSVSVTMAGLPALGFESGIDNFTIVPEPASTSFMIVAGAVLLLRRRR